MPATAQTTTTTDDDALGKAYDARLVRRLLAYVRPYRPLVVAALACIVIQSGMQLVGPLLTRWVIDRALPSRDVGLVVQVALMYAALLVAQFGAAFGETMTTSLLGQRVMRDLRRELFERLQRLPVSYFDRNPVGRLVTRVTSDVEALNELFTSGVVAGVGDLFTLLAIGVVMLAVDWQLAMAAFVVIPLVLIASRLFQNAVRTAYRDIRTRLARLNAFVGERIGGMRIVQLFGREAHEVGCFDTLNQSHLDAHVTSIRVYALYFPVIEFLTTFALASLLVTAGFRVGSSAITVGTVAAFLQLVRRFFQPLQDLSEKYNILQGAMAASERIFGLLDTPVAAGVVGAAAGGGWRPRGRGPVGAEGRQLLRGARPGDRARGAHGCGQDHHREPVAPFLRAAARSHSGKWRRYPRTPGGCAPLGHRVRAARHLSLRGRRGRQPPARRRHR